MYAWGDNTYGQLGIEASKDTKKMPFTLVSPDIEKEDCVIDIESGWNHMILLTSMVFCSDCNIIFQNRARRGVDDRQR